MIADGQSDNFLWLAVLIFATALAATIAYYAVRYVRNWSRRDEPVQSFTLQDFREMRDRGDITESEFEAMRAAMLAHHRRQADDDASPDAGKKRP